MGKQKKKNALPLLRFSPRIWSLTPQSTTTITPFFSTVIQRRRLIVKRSCRPMTRRAHKTVRAGAASASPRVGRWRRRSGIGHHRPPSIEATATARLAHPHRTRARRSVEGGLRRCLQRRTARGQRATSDRRVQGLLLLVLRGVVVARDSIRDHGKLQGRNDWRCSSGSVSSRLWW